MAAPNDRSVQVLDWRAREHFARPGECELQPCRICTLPAFCRDDAGRPCHKTCAELEGVR